MPGNSNPSTLAADVVRFPDKTNGIFNGLKITVDRTNNTHIKFEDEGSKFLGIELPSTVMPAIWLGLPDWGWEKVGDTLICFIDGTKTFEITETYFAIYNINGNKMVQINRESGDIFTRGRVLTGGIGFPA